MVFGGEGYRLDDAGEGPSPCVYILDVDNLTWQRCITHSPVEEHSPGTRSLHVTTVRPRNLQICVRAYHVVRLRRVCAGQAMLSIIDVSSCGSQTPFHEAEEPLAGEWATF